MHAAVAAKSGDYSVPRHLAVILDGNRRFARKLMLQPWKGHEWGKKKVEALLGWCGEVGVRELTLYAFSVQNFNRPKDEFDYLMKLFIESYTQFADDERVAKYGIHIRFLGRTELFPKPVQEAMRKVTERTKKFDKFFLNVAMAYGGREELVDGFRKIAQKVESGDLSPQDIDESVVSDSLYSSSEPDLIIRTGGEHRLSNFLLWQSSYAELMFLEKPWPEFEKEDFLACLDEYAKRERRFGK